MLRIAHGWKSGFALTAGVLLLGAAAAGAAESAKPRASQLQAVVDCRRISDGAQRLACYDAAAARLDAAEASGDVVVVDKAQIREARRETFGFSFKMPSFMSAGATAEEMESLDGVVKSARIGPDDKWVITLETGAVWRQIDSERVRRAPKPGSKVLIKTAALGSFRMNIDGQTAIRVRREN